MGRGEGPVVVPPANVNVNIGNREIAQVNRSADGRDAQLANLAADRRASRAALGL